jgi:hypothetical protein
VHTEIVKHILEGLIRDLHLISSNPTISDLEKKVVRDNLPHLESKAFRESDLSTILKKVESMPDVFLETQQAVNVASNLLHRELDVMEKMHKVGFDLCDRPELFLSPSDREILGIPKASDLSNQYRGDLEELFGNYEQDAIKYQDDPIRLLAVHEEHQKNLGSFSAKVADLKRYLGISGKPAADDVEAVQALLVELENVKNMISDGYDSAKTQTPLIRRTDRFLNELHSLAIKQDKCTDTEKKAISSFLTKCEAYKDIMRKAVKRGDESRVVSSVQRFMKFVEEQKNVNGVRQGSGFFQVRHSVLHDLFGRVEKLYQTTAKKQIENRSLLPRSVGPPRPGQW